MAYVSSNYAHHPKAHLGLWVGEAPYYGQCVSYVKAVIPGMPPTSAWKKGDLVRGNSSILPGTAIATFNDKGHYSGHAAIYEGQTKEGINVIDQWITPPPKPIHHRMLKFGAHGNSNNGDNFYVVL